MSGTKRAMKILGATLVGAAIITGGLWLSGFFDDNQNTGNISKLSFDDKKLGNLDVDSTAKMMVGKYKIDDKQAKLYLHSLYLLSKVTLEQLENVVLKEGVVNYKRSSMSSKTSSENSSNGFQMVNLPSSNSSSPETINLSEVTSSSYLQVAIGDEKDALVHGMVTPERVLVEVSPEDERMSVTPDGKIMVENSTLNLTGEKLVKEKNAALVSLSVASCEKRPNKLYLRTDSRSSLTDESSEKFGTPDGEANLSDAQDEASLSSVREEDNLSDLQGEDKSKDNVSLEKNENDSTLSDKKDLSHSCGESLKSDALLDKSESNSTLVGGSSPSSSTSETSPSSSTSETSSSSSTSETSIPLLILEKNGNPKQCAKDLKLKFDEIYDKIFVKDMFNEYFQNVKLFEFITGKVNEVNLEDDVLLFIKNNKDVIQSILEESKGLCDDELNRLLVTRCLYLKNKGVEVFNCFEVIFGVCAFIE